MKFCNKDLHNVVIQWDTCLYICSEYLKAHKTEVNVYWAVYIMEMYIVNVTMLLLLLLFTETIFFFPQIETYIYNNAFEFDNNKLVKLAGNKFMCDCNTAQHVRVSLSSMYSSE